MTTETRHKAPIKIPTTRLTKKQASLKRRLFMVVVTTTDEPPVREITFVPLLARTIRRG